MSKPKRRFLESDYGQIHLRIAHPDQSTHRPLVCLHQSPKSGREYVKFMEIMSEDRVVIAPDYPGYGESDGSNVNESVTISDYAKAMWQVVDTLELGQVDLFGNHTGGAVATEMAFQRPDDVGAIAMISAATFTPSEQAEGLKYYQPIPLDEAGSRFTHIWAMIVKYRSDGMTLEMMSESLAENLRGGEGYEWGHFAAFTYGVVFAERIATLPHRITVFNPDDMVAQSTRRIEPCLQNGKIIECPQWQQYVVNIHPEESVIAVREALSV